jgi:hypothetical protein
MGRRTRRKMMMKSWEIDLRLRLIDGDTRFARGAGAWWWTGQEDL